MKYAIAVSCNGVFKYAGKNSERDCLETSFRKKTFKKMSIYTKRRDSTMEFFEVVVENPVDNVEYFLYIPIFDKF